jgi:hypothetical protein
MQKTRLTLQVRRRNLAVAARTKRGSIVVLGLSARSDQWGPEKEALFQHVIDSFRVL